MEVESKKPSKVIFMTDVPELLLDRKIMRQHFSNYGIVRRVSIDKESACCSVCFLTNEGAERAFREGTCINNYKLKIMLGTGTSCSPVHEKTEPVRDTHTYDDLDMNYLDDNNDVFVLEEKHTEKELFKMKKRIIRKLDREKSPSPKDPAQRVKHFGDGDQTRLVKRAAGNESKLLKKSSATRMTSEELSKAKSLKEKYEILELRDKLYREKLKAMKLNVNSGTCPDMCPEKERIMRAHRKLWNNFFEQRPGVNRLVPELAVKEYQRSSADQGEPLPHDLRPEPVLNMTMNYLVLNIMPQIEQSDVNVSQWFDFLWDRLRSIRKDIVQQQLCSVNTAHIIEQRARFHIICFDRLCGEDASIFSEKLNTENLNDCLQSLIHMYDDLHAQNLVCPNEPEFRAYEILLNLNSGDIIWEFQKLSPHLQSAPAMHFALQVYSAFNNNLYSLFFKLVKQTTYLNACLLQRYFSVVRSKALQSCISAFCRPQDQSFKMPSTSLRDILHFDNDSDVLDFCSAHGMVLSEDGDLSTGKYDFIIPTNVSSCLATSLNMIKAKRLSLPVTIAGPAGVPAPIEHKVHSSFDTDGNLKKQATNVTDQIRKLEEDFGYVVTNVPIVEISENNMLSEYKKMKYEKTEVKSEKQPTAETNAYGRLGSTVQDNNSGEIFKTNPFRTEEIKTNPFQKEGSSSLFLNPPVGLFRTVDNTQLEKMPESKLFEKSNVATIISNNEPDTNAFKKPFALPKRFSNATKTSSELFKTPPFQSNIFLKQSTELTKISESGSDLKSTVGPSLFSKSVSTDVNTFPKTSGVTNIFGKPSNASNLFNKATADIQVNKSFASTSNFFSKPASSEALNSSTGLFSKVTSSNQVLGDSNSIFGGSKTDVPTNIVKKNSHTHVFGKPSLDSTSLFERASSFGEFMKPSSSTNQSENNDGNGSFNFLQKVSEIKNTSHQNISPGKNSGFEQSFELFVQESEQQTRKRAADEDEEERQKEFEALQREKEKERQIELEQEEKQLELLKQEEKEREMKRQRELEMQRQQEIELKRQKALEEERRREEEKKIEQALERERLRQMELEKQREWEMKVKQDVINMKVEYDLQIAMDQLAKEQKRKNREHELARMRLRKERELQKLRRVVKKKIKYIQAKKCLRKWKDRVKRLKINKLDFPQVVLASIENHTAVWGSIKHTSYRMTDRYEAIQQISKSPRISNENLYIGKELMQALKHNSVCPRFIKQNCQMTTPFVWKVSFHLPSLPDEFEPVDEQLCNFLDYFCYDGKKVMGEVECLKANDRTLFCTYHLVKNNNESLLGTNLYIFILSELWETLDESFVRFQNSLKVVNSDIEIVILLYRSSHKEDDIMNRFVTGDSVRVIKWNSASDVSQAVVSAFTSRFHSQQPTLTYENLLDFLYNEVEAVFLQLKLDLDVVVCSEEIAAQFRNPNYFINIYNTLVNKLHLITEPINLAEEFNRILFNTSDATVINDDEVLERVVHQLSLPKFKTWSVMKVSKLKKMLKHFCAVIDKSGRNELYTIVIRLLNPPKENLELYLSRVDWSKILLPCFLWNLRTSSADLHNAFIFYDRNALNSELRSHWWVSLS